MYTTLSTVKAELGISPEDTSQDARLKDLIRQASAAIDDWTGRPLGFGQRRYLETISPTRQGYMNSTPVQFVACALREALRYLQRFGKPESIVQDLPRVEAWLASVEEAIQIDPDVVCLFHKELARLECHPLSGRVGVVFEVHQEDSSHVKINRELVITVVRLGADAASTQRLDMIVHFTGWSDPSFRTSLPRRSRTGLLPYTRRRLYLPNRDVSHRGMESLVQMWVALMLLYLIQGASCRWMKIAPLGNGSWRILEGFEGLVRSVPMSCSPI